MIKFSKNDEAIIFEVSDTGIGMSPEQLNNIFKLKKRKTLGTRGEKGTGIGLNLVHRFIEMNKGIIQVSSEVRLGTKFKLSFPKAILIEESLSSTSKHLSA